MVLSGSWRRWMCVSACWLVVGIAACTPETSPEHEACVDMVAARQFEDALRTCEAALRLTSDPHVVLASARALRGVGHHDEAVMRLEALGGTPLEAEGRGVAAGSLRSLGRRDEARQAYERQLELFSTAGDLSGVSRARYGLYYLAWEASDFRPALDHAEASLQAATEASYGAGAARASRALFALYYDLGNLERASQVLEAGEAWIDPEDTLGQARHLALQGALQLDRQRFELAHVLLLRSVDLAGDDADATFLRSNYLNLVTASLELQDLESAESYLAAAAEHADAEGQRTTALLYARARVALARGDWVNARAALQEALADEPEDDWAWELHWMAGRTAAASQRPKEAMASYRASIEVLEAMRADLGLDALKPWLLEKKRRPFELLFEAQVEAGKLSAALATLEQAKARAFLDAFLERSGPSQGNDGEVTGQSDGSLLQLLPSLGASSIASSSGVEELLKHLGDRRAWIYFRTSSSYWLTCVDRGAIASLALQTPAEEIDQRVGAWLADLGDEALAHELASAILPDGAAPPPCEVDLDGKQRGEIETTPWVLVPDGALSRVPFAALPLGDGYWVERHAVQYLPSLSALKVIEERLDPLRDEHVVLADPRGDLPSAALEAEEVAEHLGVSAFLEHEARLDLMPQVSEGRVLHLAIHSGVGASGPWMDLADGRLGAATVLDRGLGAELVVLASCASGAQRGRGLWGSLGAAFLAAGSDAVVMALWSIDDAETRRFVRQFYEEGGAQEPVRALARAQRVWVGAGEDVTTWAPFVVMGSSAKVGQARSRQH